MNFILPANKLNLKYIFKTEKARAFRVSCE